MNIERLEHFTDSQKKPCIFNKGIEEWTALKKWDPQFFKRKFGNIDVTLNYNLPDLTSPYLHQVDGHFKTMSLADSIDFMAENDRCYIAQQEITNFIGLDLDFNFFNIIPKSEHKKTVHCSLWIGKNTRSGLHYDYSNNFLVQIYGIKKLFLVSPKETKYLYPLPENFTKTQVSPLEPDFKKFPKFKKATIWTGEIKPGEILYIPKGWFHYIYSPSESISLNCWYGDEINVLEFLISFYRSGWRTWMQFFKDFIWHGALKKPAKTRLFCSPSLGKLAYDNIVKSFS